MTLLHLKYTDKFDMHAHSGYANAGKKTHFLAKRIWPALWLGGGIGLNTGGLAHKDDPLLDSAGRPAPMI